MGDIVTFASISRAVADTLKAVRSPWGTDSDRHGIVWVQNYDETTEGVNDWPLLRVLPHSGNTDNFAADTERLSFGAKVQGTLFTIEVLGYAKPRADLMEDLAAQVALVDAVDVVLGQQKIKPQFGLQAIQAFNWKWEKATLQIGSGESVQLYAGVTFTLELFIF